MYPHPDFSDTSVIIKMGDKEIIRLLQKQNKWGLESLYDKYAPIMYGVISNIVHDPQKSQEVLSSTFLNVWESIGEYNEKSISFTTWCINKARSFAIKTQKLSPSIDIYKSKSVLCHVNTVSGVAKGAVANHKVTSKLTTDKEITVMDMICIKGFSPEETARKMDVSVSEVRLLMRDAIQNLK